MCIFVMYQLVFDVTTPNVIEQQHLKTILGRLQIPEYLVYIKYMPLEYKLGIKYQTKQHKTTTLFHGLINKLICTQSKFLKLFKVTRWWLWVY